jgi:hypothetical protein
VPPIVSNSGTDVAQVNRTSLELNAEDTVIELFRQALQMLEMDAKWLDDCVQQCDQIAAKLPKADRSNFQMLSVVCTERAVLHRTLAGKMREQLS